MSAVVDMCSCYTRVFKVDTGNLVVGKVASQVLDAINVAVDGYAGDAGVRIGDGFDAIEEAALPLDTYNRLADLHGSAKCPSLVQGIAGVEDRHPAEGGLQLCGNGSVSDVGCDDDCIVSLQLLGALLGSSYVERLHRVVAQALDVSLGGIGSTLIEVCNL